ncbi:hypothetical protein RUM43_011275 [Polyplax serrata]|uniref:PDZ domain-containing protein n=1 Tax=Polyplax serrata TaxID=468196 RepID=A0AAN8S0Y9_POLSC
MFNFMKKNNVEKDEKEKRKKEKEGKKKRERGGMTAEELLRLDEVRRSLKIRTKRKDKEKLPSGITADYSQNFFADLVRDPEFNRSGSLPGHTKINNSVGLNRGDGLTQSDSSEASLNSLHNHEPSQKVLPPLPPRPPKRGILKGSRSSMNSSELYDNHDPNSTSVLVRNTLQNELITYQNLPQKNNISKSSQKLNSSPEHTTSQPSGNYLTVINHKNNLLSVASTSPSAESLTDTSNSSFATPPFSLSPIGENQGFSRIHSNLDEKVSDLPLPDIIALQLPQPRELVIHRTARGDFGFQLRRAIITDKLSSVNKKTVIFAEPGALIGNKNETGLLPGDILLKVNGIQVQDKSREEIIDLIKGSGSSVTVKVRIC